MGATASAGLFVSISPHLISAGHAAPLTARPLARSMTSIGAPSPTMMRVRTNEEQMSLNRPLDVVRRVANEKQFKS